MNFRITGCSSIIWKLGTPASRGQFLLETKAKEKSGRIATGSMASGKRCYRNLHLVSRAFRLGEFARHRPPLKVGAQVLAAFLVNLCNSSEI